MLIRLTPSLGSAAVGVLSGYHLLVLIPDRVRAFLLIPLMVFFLAMIILDQEPGWNLALLGVFSISAGLVLNWSGLEVARWGTWLLFLGLFGTALIAKFCLGPVLQRGLKYLSPVTLLYMVGWVGFILWALPFWIQGAWLLFGLLLFTLIAAGVLQRDQIRIQEENPIPLSIELFVILLNLFWLSGMIYE